MLLFCYWVVWFLYIFWILTFNRVWLADIFPHLVGWLSLGRWFALLCILVWCRPTCLFLLLLPVLLVSYPKNYCQHWYQELFGCFLLGVLKFQVTLKSFVQFKLIFRIWYKIRTQYHSPACASPVFPPSLMKRLSFRHCVCWCPHHKVYACVSFGAIGLCVCFYAGNIMFAYCCNKAWSQGV